MKIIIDAMGGDNAPRSVVAGALAARSEFGVDLLLVGRQDDISACLAGEGVKLPCKGIEVVNAEQVITMEDDPSTATRRKKDSSMAVALTLLRDGAGDAMVSAGSTGALLTGATLTVKRIRGIRRAALAPVLPNGAGGVLLIDSGANVECTPEYLLQFAYMGSFYFQRVLGCAAPRVGLLNVGVEDSKGTELQKRTHALLTEAGKQGRIHFIGNVEGRELFAQTADVIVCDGFSGNILLKSAEGSITYMMKLLKGVYKKNLWSKLSALMIKKGVGGIKSMMDMNEIGGTALLGICKPVIKAHGSSDARAIRSAVKQAIDFTNAGIIGEIEANIEHMKTAQEQ